MKSRRKIKLNNSLNGSGTQPLQKSITQPKIETAKERGGRGMGIRGYQRGERERSCERADKAGNRD